MTNEHLLKLHISAQANNLCLVRALVKRTSELAGCNAELTQNLVIAVNEACMNIIQHAYKGEGKGEIILEILNNEQGLLFRLLDHAELVELDKVKPRELEDLRPGGLGTFFIQEIMDECKMGHLEDGSGNYLEMKKKIN